LRGLVLLCGMCGLLAMAVAQPMVGVIAFDWISFMNPQQEAWGAFGSGLPWALLAGVATIIGCIVAKEPKQFPVNAMTILVLVFIVLISINTAFALGPWAIVKFWYFLVLKSFLFMLIVAALLTEKRRVHALVWIMVLSLGFYGVKGGVFTILTHGNNHVVGAGNSVLGDNNQLAVAMLISLPLMNYLRLQSAHRIIRIGLVLAMVLTLFSIVGTYSRGALIALTAVSAFLWWNSKGKIMSGIALAIGLTLAIGFMPSQWVARMTTISSYKHSDSAESRITVWHEAFGLAMSRPLTGAGFRATAIPSVMHEYYPGATPRAVHSIWFEVLGQQGIPGFIVWVSMQILGFINIRRIRWLTRNDPSRAWARDLARMAEVSMIAYLVGGSLLSLGYYDFYFTLLIILASTHAILKREPVPAIVQAPRRREPAQFAVPAVAWRMRRVVR
jgi:putative inorganic carbon (HCO3(-)) transporter